MVLASKNNCGSALKEKKTYSILAPVLINVLLLLIYPVESSSRALLEYFHHTGREITRDWHTINGSVD
jgi:hypothetical protein